MRRIAFAAVMVLVPSGLLLTWGSSASALITYTGTVSCTSAGGTVTFTPPLSANGTATTETIKVKNPINPCTPSSPNVPPSVHGTIVGKVVLSVPGAAANNCGVLFPTSPGTKMFTPTPVPTTWGVAWKPTATPSHLAFSQLNVINTAGQISVAVTGTVTGSFKSPPPGGIALEGSAVWSLAAIQAACATAVGLSHLTIGTTAVDAL